MHRRSIDISRLPGALLLAAIACGGGGDKATAPNNSPASVTANVATPASAVIASPVNPTPSVIVKTAAGTPLAGSRVTFLITAGGGSVVGGSKITDASGIAAVDSWTLGSTPGSNTLTVSAGGASTVFTVNATNTCNLSGGISIGATVTGNLTTSPCAAGGGTAAQSWSFQQATGQTNVSFVMHPTGLPTFDTVLLLHRDTYAAFERLIGFNDDDQSAAATTDSRLDAILGAGSYVLSGNNFDPGVTGPFSITANTWDGEFKNCNDAFVTTGVTTNQTMATGCSYASGQLVDPVGIYLGQGQQVRFDMSSSVFDPKLDLYQVNATVPIATDDNSGGGTSARITFTAASAGIYVLLATSPAVQQVGAYTLTVTGLIGGPVAPARTSGGAASPILKDGSDARVRPAMPWRRGE